jgi:predicted Zn-dependent protease
VEATAEQLRDELQVLADALVTRFPNVPEAQHVVALTYADLQKTTEAEKIWRECIPLAPQQAGPYIGLARVLMDLGKDSQAVEILNQAQQAGCSTPDLYNQLAAALTKLGILEDAARVAREGLTKFPQSPQNWLQLGQIQNQLGEFVQAEASLNEAIARGATSETVYFALATACARQGKQAAAARYRQ